MGSRAGTLDLAGRASSALLAVCDMVVQEGSEERVGTNGKEEERVNGVADQGDEEQEKEESATDSPEEAELELDRLKELVPSVSVKDSVSQLDVILEAIRYIASLQGRLADKIESGEVVPVMVPMVSTTGDTQQHNLREEEEERERN